MKKIYLMLLTLSIPLMCQAQSIPSYNSITGKDIVEINTIFEKDFVFNKDDLLERNETIYFPLRILTNEYNYDLKWDNGKVELNETIYFELYKEDYTIGESVLEFPQPILEESKTYVPINFLKEGLGLYIQEIDNEYIVSTYNPNLIYDDMLYTLENGETYYTNQKLSFSLEENTSTGYQWEIEYPKNIKIIHDTNTYSEQIIGQPSQRNIIIQPITEGDYFIRCSYKRPWEKESIEVKTLEFKVKKFKIN